MISSNEQSLEYPKPYKKGRNCVYTLRGEYCVMKEDCALVLAFLSAENENRRLEDLSLAHFGRLPAERLLSSVRIKSINENFVN